MSRLFFATTRGYIELWEEYEDVVAVLFIIPAIFCDIILLPGSILLSLILKIKNKYAVSHANGEEK